MWDWKWGTPQYWLSGWFGEGTAFDAPGTGGSSGGSSGSSGGSSGGSTAGGIFPREAKSNVLYGTFGLLALLVIYFVWNL